MTSTVLMHLENPRDILKKMIDCTRSGGMVICMENRWDSAMANLYARELDEVCPVDLGLLQKLYHMDAKRTGKEAGVSDAVN